MMPQALTGWLRCRPKGAALNLIRKEICMLRSVWLISLVAALCWACLTLVRLRLVQDSAKSFQIVVISVAVVCTLMIAILAGSLSLGEERTSGTHSWQMTLPVSPFLQWGIKLCTALFAGFVGAWLLPLLIIGMFLYGPSHVFVNPPFGIGVLLVVLLLTFASFWCACAVDGTVAAVLWVIPVVCVLGGAGYFAQVLATGILHPFWGPKPFENLGIDPFLSVAQSHQFLNLFGNLRFDWWAASLTFRHIEVFGFLENPLFYAAIAGVPAVILALVQSYRMFRMRTSTGARLALRNLLPLVLLVFLCGFSFTALDAYWWRAGSEVNFFIGATGQAIVKALPGVAKLHPTGPVQLTVDDVAKAWSFAPLEDSTRRWLTGATITITPDKAHPSGFFCTPDPYGHAQCYYSATIHLADGTDIFQTYDPPSGNKFRWGPHSVSVRWPGAKTQEFLWNR